MSFKDLELFRRTVLSGFVSDIKVTNHEMGFPEEGGPCAFITGVLSEMAADLAKLPETNPKTRKRITRDVQNFLTAYVDWNGAAGATDDAKEIRSRKASRLQRKRESFSKSIRLNRGALHDGISADMLKIMHKSFGDIAVAWPALFPALKEELEKFR